MKIEWLKREGSRKVIVFFNGWGMDAAAVRHLETDADVLTAYDYRQLDDGRFPDLSAYTECDVVAWSMGVWAAASRIRDLGRTPDRCIAMNGTESPIHDAWGIPTRIYRMTELGMDRNGREKFLFRMFSRKDEICRFLKENNTGRSLEDVCEELVRIREQMVCPAGYIKWNLVYVSSHDVIIPTGNQLAFWKEKGRTPVMLAGGHYPFYRFRSWDEILKLPD